MKKIITTLSISYIFMILSFLTLIIGVHCIPSNLLEENVRISEQIIEEEGAYYKIANFKLFQLDNYTDALMMNIAVCGDSNHPINSAMMNYYYADQDCFHMAHNTISYLDRNLVGMEKSSYGRYWQGYQTFLRPIMTILNYNGIRIINYILLFCLAFVTIVILWRKSNAPVSLFFLLSLALINFPIVPLSMQFSTCFYVSFISMICIMLFPQLTESTSSMLCTFFVIGGVIAYLDFLTTPQLTLGLPLITMLVTSKKEHKLKVVIMCCFVWGIGYGFIWASKWLYGYLLTGNDILSDAMKSATLRTSNAYKGMEMTIPNILKFIWTNIVARRLQWVIYGSGIILFALCYIYYNCQKGLEVQKKNAWLLIVASIVPIWFLILRNHSIQHGWFTWRAGLLPIYSFMLWIYFTTRKQNVAY